MPPPGAVDFFGNISMRSDIKVAVTSTTRLEYLTWNGDLVGIRRGWSVPFRRPTRRVSSPVQRLEPKFAIVVTRIIWGRETIHAVHRYHIPHKNVCRPLPKL